MKPIILSLFLTFSLLGCKGIPKFDTHIRRLYSVQFNTCYCQFYDLNKLEKEEDFKPCDIFFAEEFEKEPVLENKLYCDDLVGFNATALAEEIKPKAKEIIRWGEDNCK